MGEAKRRKETDENYGRVPKDTAAREEAASKEKNRRGLVISPAMEIINREINFKGGVDPQELRFGLLMWDDLALPENNFIGFEETAEEQFLQSAGVLRRVRYPVEGDVANSIANGHVNVFRTLDLESPGSWAFSQGERSFNWVNGGMEPETGSLIELHRAIPIPSHDVPLAEILEFKRRRRDELLLLRTLMESFVRDIQASPDEAFALQQKIAEIDAACSNLLEVGKEWQFPVHLSNLKTSFSLDPNKVIATVGAAWLANSAFGLIAATAAAGATAIGATLSIKGDVGFRSIKRPVSPYRYAYQMYEELK